MIYHASKPGILIILLILLTTAGSVAQENVIDLGTDTIMYDKEFEYVAAFEMEKYMESFIFYRSAMDAYQHGDLFSAKAAVSKAIKLNKREYKFKMLKAWVLSKESSYKKAIKFTDKILEESPNSREALYCKAINQYQLNDHLGANITYSKLLELNDEDVRAYYGRAETKMELEDYQGAIVDFSTALVIQPSLELAYEGRAMAYFKIFDFRNAVKDFNQLLVAKPGSGKGYYYRGLSHLRLSEFGLACKSFEQAVKLKYKDANEYHSKYCNF